MADRQALVLMVFGIAIAVFVFGFVAYILFRRKNLRKFFETLPQHLNAVKLTLPSSPNSYWLKGKINNDEYIMMLRKRSGTQNRTIVLEWIVIVPIHSNETLAIFNKIHPIVDAMRSKLNQWVHPDPLLTKPQSNASGNRQGHFSSQLIIAPFEEIFKPDAVPFKPQTQWYARAVLPFTMDSDVIINHISTILDASR